MADDRTPTSDEQRGAKALAKLMAAARENYRPEQSNTGTEIIRPKKGSSGRQRSNTDSRDARSRGGEPR